MPILFLLCSISSQARTAEEEPRPAPGDDSENQDRIGVRIADPFIELRTGPASGYPVFHVIDRGVEVFILRRKTNWFKIETGQGLSGWASREQMRQTLLPDGERLEIAELGEADFARRNWVLGFTSGEFENAPGFSLFGAYSFTENLVGEAHFGHSVGSQSSSDYLRLNLLMLPVPEWKYAPFMTLGMGRINVDPGARLIVADDEENSFAQVGAGLQTYISRRFLLRFEVSEYVIFSTNDLRNDNEEVDEWKFGFAVFF